MAQAWADACFFGHGQPAGLSSPYQKPGQNLYFNTGEVNMTRVVENWFNEKENYNLVTGCKANEVCGHYLQVRSYKVLHCSLLQISSHNFAPQGFSTEIGSLS